MIRIAISLEASCKAKDFILQKDKIHVTARTLVFTSKVYQDLESRFALESVAAPQSTYILQLDDFLMLVLPLINIVRRPSKQKTMTGSKFFLFSRGLPPPSPFSWQFVLTYAIEKNRKKPDLGKRDNVISCRGR